MRKDITVTHMKSATAIDSEDTLFTFDYKAGDSMMPITCMCLFEYSEDFLDDIQNSKIAKYVPHTLSVYYSKEFGSNFSFIIQPQFGYTKQKLEDILCNLFDKYNLETIRNMEIKLTPDSTFNPSEQQITINGVSSKLTKLESRLLEFLYNNKNELSERSTVLTEIWTKDNYFTARSMDVYICRLKKILKPLSEIEILNIHGKGHKLLIDELNNS